MIVDGDGTGEAGSIEILFDRLMLVELRENVAKLDAQAYAELKSYKEPPAIVHLILKSVLAVFYTEKALADEFENWDNCKKVRYSLTSIFNPFPFNITVSLMAHYFVFHCDTNIQCMSYSIFS